MSRAGATLARPRLHLPPEDAAAWRSRMPAPAPAHQLATTAGEHRWSWYWPVTALIVVAMIVVVAVVAGWPATPAPAGALAPITDPDELRTVGSRALGLVAYPWHDLGYEIVFAPGQAKVRAQTDIVAHRITVFLSRGDAAHRVAHDIGHELGHAFDAKYLSDAQRLSYLQARGVPGATWFPGGRFSDYNTGAGDFAETFAACHAASPEFRSRLASKPVQPCALIPQPGHK